MIYFEDAFLNLSHEENHGTFNNIQFNYFCHTPFATFDSTTIGALELLFTQITEEFNQPMKNEEALRSYLKLILIHYQRAIKSNADLSGAGNKFSPVIQLRMDIEKHFKTHKTSLFYSDRQNLSLKRLNEITKEAIGKTILNLIHERVLLEAKRLLSLTNKSVKEIAFYLGFEDPPYFYRFFKKHEGLTPEDFRKMFK